jgi:chemotaxis protein MotB
VTGRPGPHGGSWKVALADFMTSMFALFLVLWLVASSDVDQRSKIAGWFRDPSVWKEGSPQPIDLQGSDMPREETPPLPPPPALRRRDPAVDAVAAAVEADPALGEHREQVSFGETEEGYEIGLHDTAGKSFFELGSATLNPDGRVVVARVGAALASSEAAVLLAGHTDSTPFGGAGRDNWHLSADRAQAVRIGLLEAGVAASRITAVIGYADTRLQNPGDPRAPENRRVTVLVTGGR